MATGLRVELSETTLMASPSGAVTTRCTVYNASMIVDEYRLQVSGVDPSWVEVPATTSRIFPEASETVAIRFKPPRSAAVAAADYPFTITGTSVDNAAVTGATNGVLTVGPFVDFGFDVDSPRQASGEIEGTFTLRATNLGNARLTLALDAAEESEQVDFAFSEPQVVIGPGESRQVTLTVRPKTVRLGAGAVYQVNVGAAIVAVSPPMSIAPEQERRSTVVMFQYVPGVTEPPRLEPQTIELAGQHAQTEVVLTNRSAIPVVMNLQGSDKALALAFEFVGGNRVTVAPGQVNRVPVRITCLDVTKLSPAPMSTSFTITATPVEPAGDPRSVQGDLTQPGPADFRLLLEPEVVESTGPERVRLTVENVSKRSATFTIAATSKDAALAIAVGAEQVSIPGQDRVVVPVDLTPKDGLAAPAGGARPSDYSIRVAPADAPSRANEVLGRYVFTPASLAMRLRRQEIESAEAATFDVEVENTGKSDVSVAMEASDRAASCTYAFDLPRLRIPGRSSALVRLTVTPPKEHRPDARWQFEVLAKPTAPVGPPMREEGVLIYRAPTVGLTLNPQERKGRRRRAYNVMLTNPTTNQMSVRLTAVDRSGGLGVSLDREMIELPPAGRGSAKVPLKVTPWKRSRGSGAASLLFNVAATPISPPGDAVTTEGRFVALPPHSRWFWVAILLVVFVAYLFSPLYEHTFYLLGWQRSRVFQGKTWDGEHHIYSDVTCIYHRVLDGEKGQIKNLCFAQGPPPPKKTAGVQLPGNGP